jgi:hypothetical protein
MLSVGMVTIGDSIALFTGGRPASLGSAIQEASPPLFASVVAAMSDWLQPATLEIDPISLAVKLAIWAVASLVVLVWAFQREELSG